MKTSQVFLKKVQLGAIAAAVLLSLSACNLGESSVTINDSETDAGFNVEERDADEGGEDTGDPDVGDPDTGTPDAGDPDPELPTEAREWCAAGGVATGEGIRLIHCTAPASVTGPTLEGDGVRLETGASRIILP